MAPNLAKVKKQEVERNEEKAGISEKGTHTISASGHSWHEPSYRGLETRKIKGRDRESHFQDELDLPFSSPALVGLVNRLEITRVIEQRWRKYKRKECN